MDTPSEATAIVSAMTPPKGRLFGYDAVEDKQRRKPPVARNRSEDMELNVSQRAKLAGSTRDLQRNFTIAAWMIRKHLDYVSTFSFQARTGVDALDERLEELMRQWSHRKNCDAARRHTLARMIRLAEARRTVDGDVFCVKLADGRLQWVEGDRVRTPLMGLPPGLDQKSFVHGVQVNKAGEALAYCICKRTTAGGFEFERLLRSDFVEHHGFFDRFDQVRGISPLAPAINTLVDTYESFDYALAKAKVAQLFALAFYRDAEDTGGEIVTGGADADADGEVDDKAGYEVNFGRGPIKLDLDPGDRAEFLESKSPSSEFQAFTQAMLIVALKALDIPYSFYDESFTNYSGSRGALLGYEQSANIKREDNRQLLSAITAWRIRLWILDGQLVLPAGLPMEGLRWEWIAKGTPWLDPLKEVQADIAAVGAGLTSRTRRCKQRGEDFFEIVDELAAENAYLTERGLPTKADPSNVQIVEIAK